MSDVLTETWFGIEMWLPGLSIWWSSGTRFDSPEEATGRIAELPPSGLCAEHKAGEDKSCRVCYERPTRVTRFVLTREPVGP